MYPCDAQVMPLKREAAEWSVSLRVQKLDVTNDGDRRKALGGEVEILVNKAGVLEGGPVLNIPGANMRNEFEVNVIKPLLLTQGIAKQIVKRGKGRIVWVSSSVREQHLILMMASSTPAALRLR